jgi:guanylate kinase
VISGPSGSGKTTLLKALLAARALKKKLVKSVSFTTRPKRSGEKNKRDYFFINRKEFIRARRAKRVLEWTRYLGYYYATPKLFLQKQIGQGKNIALCLDLKGAKNIKANFPGRCVSIFIRPPSLGTLQKRMQGRCPHTSLKEIRQRLNLARREIQVSGRYDYSLVNQEFRQTIKALEEIILQEIAGNNSQVATC